MLGKVNTCITALPLVLLVNLNLSKPLLSQEEARHRVVMLSVGNKVN